MGTATAPSAPLRRTPVGGPSRASFGFRSQSARGQAAAHRVRVPPASPPARTLRAAPVSNHHPLQPRTVTPAPAGAGAPPFVPLTEGGTDATVGVDASPRPVPSPLPRAQAEADMSALSTLQQSLIAKACRSTDADHRRLLCAQLLALYRTTDRLAQPSTPAGTGEAHGAARRNKLELRQAGNAHRLVRGLVGMGELDDAKSCLELALRRGLFPSLASFQALADALFRSRRTSALSGVLRDAVEHCPDAAVLLCPVIGDYLRNLLHRHAGGGDFDQMPEIYDALRVWSQRYHNGHLLGTFCVDLMTAILGSDDERAAATLQGDLLAGRLVARLSDRALGLLHQVAQGWVPSRALPDSLGPFASPLPSRHLVLFSAGERWYNRPDGRIAQG